MQKKKMVRSKSAFIVTAGSRAKSPRDIWGLNLLLGQGSKAVGSFSEPMSIVRRTTKQSVI